MKRRVPWHLALPNLALLILFPWAWFQPLMTARFLPLISRTTEVTVISGLQTLWRSDVFLALMVTFFALLAPYLKTIGLALVHFRLLSPRVLPVLFFLGKLAMADVFLIALYIVAARGMGVGKLEVQWGLYFFTGCILASLALSLLTERAQLRRAG